MHSVLDVNSLEYQNLKQIIIETLLQWDVKKQTAKGVGIVGTTLAFAPADEEQGRLTLHSHWQIWTKELNQDVRDMLFDNDEEKRSKARQFFCAHIDEIMNATYGTEIKVTHKCHEGDVKTDTPVEDIFRERKPRIIRNARHKKLSNDVKGEVLECPVCNETISTPSLINLALARWKEYAIQGITESRPDLTLPISAERGGDIDAGERVVGQAGRDGRRGALLQAHGIRGDEVHGGVLLGIVVMKHLALGEIRRGDAGVAQ